MISFRATCVDVPATGLSLKATKVSLRMPGLELVALSPRVVVEEPRMEFVVNKLLRMKWTIKVRVKNHLLLTLRKLKK